MPFRCAAASRARDEQLHATASTVRAFLLVENPGPWGADALRDARMPDPVRAALRGAQERGVRVLLARRHGGFRASAGGTTVLAAYADPEHPWLEASSLSEPERLLDLDLPGLARGRSLGLPRTDASAFCVCTQGRHDACCAELGRPTAAALAAAHPAVTWEVSHMGGDRFAANVLVLPDGLYYGRVPAAEAASLARRHLAGELSLGLLRGRSGYGFAVQAAEIALRRSTAQTRIDAVRLVSSRSSGPETRVVLELAGTAYDVLVRRTVSEERHRLTCQAVRDSPIPSYEVVSLSPAPSGAASSAPPSPPSRCG
jgi:hypothetical protein